MCGLPGKNGKQPDMKRLIAALIVLLLLLAGCFPDLTATPTPDVRTPTPAFLTPTPEAWTPTPVFGTPIPGANLLRNPSFTFMPGQSDFALCQAPAKSCATWPEWFARTLPVGAGQIDRQNWRDLSFPNARNFMAQPGYAGAFNLPWLDFLVPQFGTTAQELNIENDTGVYELHQSGIRVERDAVYDIYVNYTPFVLAVVPESWSDSALYLQELMQGGGATVQDWVGREDTALWWDMQICRLLVVDSNEANRPPYADSGWFDGNGVAAQTGKASYEMIGGDYVRLETTWHSDDTHCQAATCDVTLIMQCATREVDGIVPHLSGIYTQYASFTRVN